MTSIFLIRHGLTDETGKKLSGRTPGLLLNRQGREQARQLALKLKDRGIAAIFSSPLERALETAGPLSDALHLPVIISEEFIELNFGKWTNRLIEELRIDMQFKQFNTFRSCTRPPGGELMSEAQLRMVAGLEKLHDVYRDQAVAVFSHGDPIRSVIAFYAGIHLDMISRIEISPASVSMIGLYPDTVQIISVNETVPGTGSNTL